MRLLWRFRAQPRQKDLHRYLIIYNRFSSFNLIRLLNLDRRQGLCFSKLIHGRCTTHNRETKKVTKADCCCTMGEAWGPRCELCPSKYSPQYQDLCLESGITVDGQGNLPKSIKTSSIKTVAPSRRRVPNFQ